MSRRGGGHVDPLEARARLCQRLPGESATRLREPSRLPAWRDYYYGIPVDGWYPDFIIVGPDLGLVVLEVKDGRLKSTWRHRSRRHHGLLKSRTAMQLVTA